MVNIVRDVQREGCFNFGHHALGSANFVFALTDATHCIFVRGEYTAADNIITGSETTDCIIEDFSCLLGAFLPREITICA